ncbi:MAG TPA: hypothetical protein VHA13_06160 [Gammaproteobacteria bacterium]|nr:hypothetical protein [Gammaproteobacteria bacterium]
MAVLPKVKFNPFIHIFKTRKFKLGVFRSLDLGAKLRAVYRFLVGSYDLFADIEDQQNNKKDVIEAGVLDFLPFGLLLQLFTKSSWFPNENTTLLSGILSAVTVGVLAVLNIAKLTLAAAFTLVSAPFVALYDWLIKPQMEKFTQKANLAVITPISCKTAIWDNQTVQLGENKYLDEAEFNDKNIRKLLAGLVYKVKSLDDKQCVFSWNKNENSQAYIGLFEVNNSNEVRDITSSDGVLKAVIPLDYRNHEAIPAMFEANQFRITEVAEALSESQNQDAYQEMMPKKTMPT